MVLIWYHAVTDTLVQLYWIIPYQIMKMWPVWNHCTSGWCHCSCSSSTLHVEPLHYQCTATVFTAIEKERVLIQGLTEQFSSSLYRYYATYFYWLDIHRNGVAFMLFSRLCFILFFNSEKKLALCSDLTVRSLWNCFIIIKYYFTKLTPNILVPESR